MVIAILFIYCILMLLGRLSKLAQKFMYILDTGIYSFLNEVFHVVIFAILAIDFGLRIFSVTHTGLW